MTGQESVTISEQKMSSKNRGNHSITPRLKSLMFLCMILFCAMHAFSQPPKSSFVVLPLITNSEQVNLHQIYTENLIESLKKNGFNAVGTRYLTAALKMEACTTIVCMKKITSLVGAHYAIYGTLSGDTTTFQIGIELINVRDERVYKLFERTIVGGSVAMKQVIPELTTAIFDAIRSNGIDLKKPQTGADIKPTTSNNSDNLLIVSVPDTVALPLVDSTKVESLVAVQNVSKQETEKVTANRLQENVIDSVIKQEKTALAVPDTSVILQVQSNDSVIINDTKINAQSNLDTIELHVLEIQSDSTSVVVDKSVPKVELSTPPASVVLTDTDRSINKGRLGTPPRHFSTKKSSKISRILVPVFGCAGTAGLISGLVYNEKARKSILSEKDAFESYMNSDASRANAKYKSYKNQTEETDRYFTYRNILYGFAGASAVCFVISFRF